MINTQRILFPSLVGILLFVFVAGLDAQEVSLEPGCKDPNHTGVIRGQVINDSTGLPAPRHGVVIQGREVCLASPDSTASFEVRNVPPGHYELSVGDLSIRIFKPIPVTVAGDTVYVEVRVEPYNVVADCEEMSECISLLEPRLETELPENVDPLIEVGLRTGIAVAIARRYGHPDDVPCIVGATPQLLEALRPAAPAATDASECENQGEPLRELLYHTPSGRRGFWVSFNPIERSEDEALGGMSFGFGNLAALGHECSYRRTGDGWRLVSCRIVWVS